MKPIIKYSLIFIYFLFYLSIVASDYNLLERSLNNMNNIDVFYDSLKPLYSIFLIPPILIYLYSYKNIKIWIVIFLIMMIKLYSHDFLSEFIYNDLNNNLNLFRMVEILIVLCYLTITSMLIIRKVKIKKYIYGTLTLLASMLLVFWSVKNENNIERQECLEQKRELIWCKEYYYMDRIFYDKLLEIEANRKPNEYEQQYKRLLNLKNLVD